MLNPSTIPTGAQAQSAGEVYLHLSPNKRGAANRAMWAGWVAPPPSKQFLFPIKGLLSPYIGTFLI